MVILNDHSDFLTYLLEKLPPIRFEYLYAHLDQSKLECLERCVDLRSSAVQQLASLALSSYFLSLRTLISMDHNIRDGSISRHQWLIFGNNILSMQLQKSCFAQLALRAMSFSPANSEEFKSLLEKAVSVERVFVRQNFIEHLSICEDLNEMADNMLIALKTFIEVRFAEV